MYRQTPVGRNVLEQLNGLVADLDAPLGIRVRIMVERSVEGEEKSVKKGLRQQSQLPVVEELLEGERIKWQL